MRGPTAPAAAALRHRAQALESWLWTGPVGHLIGGMTDLAVALWRYWAARAAAGTGTRSSRGASARPRRHA